MGNEPVRHLSRTRHVEAGLNPRGPSRKAKYSLATDSEPSSASERWEEPLQGEDSEPETTCLQAVRARLINGPLCTLEEALQIENCKYQIVNWLNRFAIFILQFSICNGVLASVKRAVDYG